MNEVIGIDLGTTNCAVAVGQQTADGTQITDFPIVQLVHPGQADTRSTMPSFLYTPGSNELPTGSTALPWDSEPEHVTGLLAREQSAKVPHRVVNSAKSWLSNENVDRNAPILPWQAPDEVRHLSPVEASSAYLQHIISAWNYANPDNTFDKHEVVLTVPASFDAVARELTAQAAKLAGITNLTLLEEPQAAFYAWLDQNQEAWRDQVGPGDRILVCDIGGGTTDFSLIVVSDKEGDLNLERIAVGDHLLLGGDNMDLALAASVQQRLKKQGTKLDSWQMQIVTHGCRVGKEQLLQEWADEDWPITIPGRGSSLIASSLRTQLQRQEIETLLVEGFFPRCQAQDCAMRGRRLGLTELALPFESEPAITKHLARFLTVQKHAVANDEQISEAQKAWSFFHPTAILFNGGVLKAAVIRKRLVEVINAWLTQENAPAIRVLPGAEHDLAVSRGAARYGLVRRGQGIRIRGGLSRTYYIGIETAQPAIPGLEPTIRALCVAPFGMEEGTEIDVPQREFGLVVGQPVEFRFLGSTKRNDDEVGQHIDDWEEDIEEITTIGATMDSTTSESGTIIPVRLQTRVTEVGTLELWCMSSQSEQSWKLELDVREKKD